MREGHFNVNCVQAVLTIPLQYSEYVLRLHDGLQWNYTRAAEVEPAGLLRWGQTKSLYVKQGALNIQLIGSSESSIQIVSTSIINRWVLLILT